MCHNQRASVIGFVVVLGVFAVCFPSTHSASGQGGDKKGPAKSGFGDNITVPANLSYVTTVTPDKLVATTIFANCLVDVSPTVAGTGSLFGQTASKTKVATIRFPFETDQRSVKLTVDVRGFRSVGSGAHARLILCAGEATKIINTSPSSAKVELKGKVKDAYKDAKFSDPIGDFADRVEVTVQKHAANPVCQVTLLLQVDQDTDVAGAGGALLVVDSLDISIAKGRKSK